MNRRMALKQTAVAVAALAPFGSVFAQPDTWPSRTITMVLPAAAGSGTDLMARELANRLSTVLKQPIIVDNKPGASGLLGNPGGGAGAGRRIHAPVHQRHEHRHGAGLGQDPAL